MINYQKCHGHCENLTYEINMAHELLKKHNKFNSEIIKEFHNKTNMSLIECYEMLQCIWRDIEFERIQTENIKLKEMIQRLDIAIATAYIKQKPPTSADVLIAHENDY